MVDNNGYRTVYQISLQLPQKYVNYCPMVGKTESRALAVYRLSRDCANYVSTVHV